MSKLALKGNTTGLFFVKGAAFSAKEITKATTFETKDAAVDMQTAIGNVGLEASTLVEVPATDPNITQNADGSSYAVSFVRPKDLNPDGTVKSHRLNPSKRRFATKLQAMQHGSRFAIIEKHLGFYVTKTKDPVNSYVSPTGKTNPVIGKGRTNR